MYQISLLVTHLILHMCKLNAANSLNIWKICVYIAIIRFLHVGTCTSLINIVLGNSICDMKKICASLITCIICIRFMK